MSVTDSIPTTEEFIEQASASKTQLIERLAAQTLATGFELAHAAFEYYILDVPGTKGSPEWVAAKAKRADLDWRYDALKHAVSALQSTLRAERVGMMERDL